MFRQGSRVCHPSWSRYADCAQESDETGARICAAVYRKDVLAIREGAVLMSSSMVKPRMRMLVSLLASTYYFPWPSHAFILRIVGLACKEPSKASLARIGGEVYEQFKAFRVVDGQLANVAGRKGMSNAFCCSDHDRLHENVASTRKLARWQSLTASRCEFSSPAELHSSQY